MIDPMKEMEDMKRELKSAIAAKEALEARVFALRDRLELDESALRDERERSKESRDSARQACMELSKAREENMDLRVKVESLKKDNERIRAQREELRDQVRILTHGEGFDPNRRRRRNNGRWHDSGSPPRRHTQTNKAHQDSSHPTSSHQTSRYQAPPPRWQSPREERVDYDPCSPAYWPCGHI